MDPTDIPVNVPIDDPNADTEWNDILRKHGIIPEKPPSPTPLIEEALEEARRLAHENRLEGKDLDELAELEDEEDEDFLEQYRRKRLEELSTINAASVFNQVYHLQKPDYSKDVTDASHKAYVCVLLTSSQGTNVESRILIEIWRELAQRYGDVKFCQMRADLCIEHYPEKNTPTVLIYKDGDIRRQLVTLRELEGRRTKTAGTLCNGATVEALEALQRGHSGFTQRSDYGDTDVEQVLVKVGAIRHGDPRAKREVDATEHTDSKIRRGQSGADEDSDWD